MYKKDLFCFILYVLFLWQTITATVFIYIVTDKHHINTTKFSFCASLWKAFISSKTSQSLGWPCSVNFYMTALDKFKHFSKDIVKHILLSKPLSQDGSFLSFVVRCLQGSYSIKDHSTSRDLFCLTWWMHFL